MPDRIRGEDREQLTNGLELGCLRSEPPIRRRFPNLDVFVPFPHAKPKLPGVTLWRGSEYHLHAPFGGPLDLCAPLLQRVGNCKCWMFSNPATRSSLCTSNGVLFVVTLDSEQSRISRMACAYSPRHMSLDPHPPHSHNSLRGLDARKPPLRDITPVRTAIYSTSTPRTGWLFRDPAFAQTLCSASPAFVTINLYYHSATHRHEAHDSCTMYRTANPEECHSKIMDVDHRLLTAS